MSKPVFFGGDATDLGHVRRLPQSSFRDLVDQVLNLAVPLNVTREQFLAMPKHERQKAKRVPYVVPCSFADSPSQRLLELAREVCLLCLDVDDARQAGPFLSAPEVVAEQLMPFNFAVHTTASSTPQAPRVRLLVEADRLPPDRYADALADLSRRLGLPGANRESRVVVQPMFLPTLFKGEDAHPLVWSEVGGRAYRLSDLGADQPLAGDGPARPVELGEADDDLDFLRNPVDEVTLRDAASALAALDPDCGYAEWLDVAAALRHQFQGDDGEAAYELFDEWSSAGGKYVGREDTRAKWDSLKPQPRGRAPVTIRTVLKRAKDAGWNAGAAQERLFSAVRARIRTYPDAEVARLMHEGIDWVAATPLLTKSEEEALLQEISRRLSAAKMKVSLSSLRKDLRAHKALADAQREKKERVPAWAKGLCYVAHVNQFFRPASGEVFSPEALDRAYGNRLLPSEEQLKEAGDHSIGTRSRPVVQPQDYLLNIVQVPVVYDYLYEPQQPNDAFLHVDGRAYVNTYLRNYPEPAPEEAEECGALLMRHLQVLIAEPAYQEIVLHWMAHIVQRPGVKIRWAVLLQGAEGCGKTVLADALSACLGPGHVKPIDGKALGGGWNEWAYGTQVVALEEVRVAGQNRHEVMNALKPLITNETVNINQRHRDSRPVPNRANFILFTNHHDALAVSNNDRRYCVIKSPLQTKPQVRALGGRAYFDPLYKMIEQKAAGLRSFLEQVRIPESFPTNGPAPDTVYMDQLVQDAASEPMAMLREILADGENPLVRGDVLSSVTLGQMLNAACDSRVSSQYLASLLREEGFRSLGRHTVAGVKHTVWARSDGSDGSTDESALAVFVARAEAADPMAMQELL